MAARKTPRPGPAKTAARKTPAKKTAARKTPAKKAAASKRATSKAAAQHVDATRFCPHGLPWFSANACRTSFLAGETCIDDDAATELWTVPPAEPSTDEA